jgi:nucleotide-binding universal stress UspA family protein
MATNKRSALDRWLNDSVTDEVIRSAAVPVLVVPPEWDRTLEPQRSLRMLVPLDGSRLAEQALLVAVRLADVFTTHLVLLRATLRDEEDAYGAREYIRRISKQAFWVRADGLFPTDMRIPVEWIQETDVQGNLRIDATKADIETYLGHESRLRLHRPPGLPGMPN